MDVDMIFHYWDSEANSLDQSTMVLYRDAAGADAWVKKGDFFKISTVQLGYNFDKNLLNLIKLEGARVYVAIQNLATFSSYNKYGDPEVGQGSVLYTGLDSGRYPMPRTYSFGLNIQF